jgi:membrane protease subunit (stomatin/prohibitin family)
MPISELIKFEGPADALVWKYPIEDFNATSQLVVDETHEALLVVNGNAADLFPPGRRTLAVPNIPLASKLINIPTGGKSPFPCKVFFINKVHHMDLLWGTQGPITLNDPLYDIFLHVGLCGSMTVVISDSRKFMLKCAGFRDIFDPEALIKNFRGIISSYVKRYVSKIMINGLVSYFVMNANLFEIAEVVKEKLDDIFSDYGVEIVYFNIETITVPAKDYEAITKAKERRSTRILEGYTWQEERQMAISEKFAGNEGTMGNIGGAVGGFMMGGAFGGTISDIARSALSEERIPSQRPPKDTTENPSPINDKNTGAFNVAEFFEEETSKPETEADETSKPESKDNGKFCHACGNKVPFDAAFCSKCGQKLDKACLNCNTKLSSDACFCHKCGTKTD